MDTKYYINLLIKQYHNKEKAKGTIETLTESECLSYNNIISKLNASFNIETATGEQLDILGQIIGRSRMFEGIEFEGTNTPNSLDDETYRTLLKMQIINNFMTKSIANITQATFDFLGDKVIFINNTNMTIDYILIGSPDNNLIKVVEFDKSVLPAPAGVNVDYIIDIPTPNIFGFSKNNKIGKKNIVGFSTNKKITQGTFITNNNII